MLPANATTSPCQKTGEKNGDVRRMRTPQIGVVHEQHVAGLDSIKGVMIRETFL